MVDEPKNQSESHKTPEQELAELLRQSGAKKFGGLGSVATPKILADGLGETRRNSTPINWLAIAIGLLTLVLVFGTGYFFLSGMRFNTGEVTFELNESQVKLAIDGEERGTIDTNYATRLKAGTHQIKLEKDGFLSIEKVVEVGRKDKLLLTLQLLPVPAIEKVLDNTVKYVRLNQDGSEIAYFDTADKNFKSLQLTDKQKVTLFRGSFSSTIWAEWAPADETVLVKLSGKQKLDRMVDNRNLKGRYIVLGERPAQGSPKYDGSTTWLFNDNRRTAAGWQPILLNESVRQIAFGPGGREVVYIYDTADGEYSLVRALPDGQEWERIVTDMPKLGVNAKIDWSNDEQHVLINNNEKLLLVDLYNRTAEEVATDRLAGSQYAFSPAGDKLAYIVKNGDQTKLVLYDLMANTIQDVANAEVSAGTVFAWLDDITLIMANQNKTFVRLNLESQEKTTIPFVGTDVELIVRSMQYSPTGKVLMLTTEQGIFTMKI